jgi:hypothetical protein
MQLATFRYEHARVLPSCVIYSDAYSSDGQRPCASMLKRLLLATAGSPVSKATWVRRLIEPDGRQGF